MSEETTEVTTPAADAPPPEAAPADAPPETAAPAEKTPEQVAAEQSAARKAERISRAAEAEKRAAEARESRRVRADIAKAESERQRLAQERQAWDEQRKAEAEAIKRGGLPALKARGLDYAELTKAYIDESSPEAQERQRLIKEAEEAKAAANEAKAYIQQAQVEKAFAEISKTLEDHADDYQYAYELSPVEFRNGVAAIAKLMVSNGRQPTYTSVLKALDENAKTIHDAREQRRAAFAKRSSASQPRDTNGRNAIPATRTLSSQDGSQRASTGTRQKTEAELDEEIARTIAPMLRQE